jgi:hypothetical protein
MKKLTQEQYEIFKAQGWDDTKIETIAKSQGFKMPDNRGILEKASGAVSKVFPGGKIGESIGTLAGLGITAGKEKLGLVPKGSTSLYDISSTAKPLQVVGDVASGALNIAGMKGVGIGKTALQTIGKGAGLGAGLSGTRAIAEGGKIEDVAKSTISGGITGGAVSGVMVGAGSIASGIKQLPERFVRSALGQSKKEILAGKDLTKFITENKKVGTANTLFKNSQDHIEKLSNEISTKLIGTTKKISPNSIYSSINKTPEVVNSQLKSEDIKKIIERLAPQSKKLLNQKTLTLTEANKLRQLLDRTIGDKGFLTAQQPLDKTILKNFSDTIREQVKTLAPEGTRNLFTTLSKEITLRNTLANKMAQGSRNQIISFGDLIGGGLGGAVGGLPGAFAGAAARRAIQSTPFLTGAAVATDKLSTTLLPILKQLEPSVQTQIINAINSAVNPKKQK